MKAIVTILATPDEVASALLDEKYRIQWDTGLLKMTKQASKEEMAKFEYDKNYLEMVKTHCVRHENRFFIQEYVNADFYRYFILERLENRPDFLRVTMYTKVSPEAHEKRGRDTYRSL